MLVRTKRKQTTSIDLNYVYHKYEDHPILQPFQRYPFSVQIKNRVKVLSPRLKIFYKVSLIVCLLCTYVVTKLI